MGLTCAASYFVNGTDVATTSLVTSTFTPAVGEVLVIKVIGAHTTITIGTPTGGNTGGFRQVLSNTTNCPVKIFTGTVATSSATAITAPFTGTGNYRALVVERWSGGAHLTPVLGGPTTTVTGTGAPSATMLSHGVESVMTWLCVDSNVVSGASRSYRTTSATPTEDAYTTHAADYTIYSAYQAAASPATQTMGLTAPSAGLNYRLFAIEIQALPTAKTGLLPEVIQHKSATVASGAANCTVTLDNDPTVGNVLMLFTYTAAQVNYLISTISDWWYIYHGSGAALGDMYVYIKVATAADTTTYVFTPSAGTPAATCYVVELEGFYASEPATFLDRTVAYSSAGSLTSLAGPTITASPTTALVLCANHRRDTTAATGTNSGWTNGFVALEEPSPSGNGSANVWSSLAVNRVNGVAGNYTTTPSWTPATTASTIVLVALESPNILPSPGPILCTITIPPVTVRGAASLITSYFVNTGLVANLTSLATPAFTPAIGELIIVKVVAGWTDCVPGTPNISAPGVAGYLGGYITGYTTGGGLGYDPQITWATPDPYFRLFTAVTDSTDSMTVTVPFTGNPEPHAMVVERWRNARVAPNPVVTAVSGTGAPSATLATTTPGSVVSWFCTDNQTGDGTDRAYRTASAVPVEEAYFSETTYNSYTFYSAYQIATSVGSQTIGLTAPNQTWRLYAIEVQSDPGLHGAAITATPIACAGSLPTLTPSAGISSTVTATPIAVAAALPVPTATASVSVAITVTVVETDTTFPVVTATAGATPTVTAVRAAATIPAVQAGWRLTATPIAATTYIPAVAVIAVTSIDGPTLELTGFGPFPAVHIEDVIQGVTIRINQYGSTAGMGAASFQLWDNGTAQIGATQTGEASTDPNHIDTATISGGITYAQLATLRLRITPHSGTADPDETWAVNWATITVQYIITAGTAYVDAVPIRAGGLIFPPADLAHEAQTTAVPILAIATIAPVSVWRRARVKQPTRATVNRTGSKIALAANQPNRVALIESPATARILISMAGSVRAPDLRGLARVTSYVER